MILLRLSLLLSAPEFLALEPARRPERPRQRLDALVEGFCEARCLWCLAGLLGELGEFAFGHCPWDLCLVVCFVGVGNRVGSRNFSWAGGV
jgi:hypothetical protein